MGPHRRGARVRSGAGDDAAARIVAVLHAIAGTTVPSVDVARAAFTSVDPVSWTLTVPPWLAPSTRGGVRRTRRRLRPRRLGLDPGKVTGTVASTRPPPPTAAPAARSRRTLHRDERVGPRHRVAETPRRIPAPRSRDRRRRQHRRLGRRRDETLLMAARVDGAGAAGTPTPITNALRYKYAPVIAFDGRNYLVVWYEVVQTFESFQRHQGHARRRRRHARRRDAGSRSLEQKRLFWTYSGSLGRLRRRDIHVVWEIPCAARSRRASEPAGRRRRHPAPKTAVQLYPDKGRASSSASSRRSAARTAAAWSPGPSSTGDRSRRHFIDKAYALVLEGGTPLDPVARPISRRRCRWYARSPATASTSPWPASPGRPVPSTAHSTTFRWPPASARTVSARPGPDSPRRSDGRLRAPIRARHRFDGSAYVVPFAALATPPPAVDRSATICSARDSRPPAPSSTTSPSACCCTSSPGSRARASRPRASPASPSGTSTSAPSGRVSSSPRPPARRHGRRYPTAVIGEIGTLSVAEGEDLLRTIAAPPGFRSRDDVARRDGSAARAPSSIRRRAPSAGGPHGIEAGTLSAG